MSVQLIVYPQSYNGSSNAISNNPNQFLIDGQDFSTLNISSSFVSSASPSLVMQDAIDNYSSIAVNTWQDIEIQYLLYLLKFQGL